MPFPSACSRGRRRVQATTPSLDRANGGHPRLDRKLAKMASMCLPTVFVAHPSIAAISPSLLPSAIQ